MTLDTGAECPVCKSKINDADSREYNDCRRIQCGRCGTFEIGLLGSELIRNVNNMTRDAISYRLRQISYRNEGRPLRIDTDLIRRLIADAQFPNPIEQAENLILWLGKRKAGSKSPIDANENITLRSSYIASIAGCSSSPETVAYLLRQMMGARWLEQSQAIPRGEDPIFPIRLTFEGWRRFEEIKTSPQNGRRGFMAMEFGNSRLDVVYRECFVAAVSDAGFTLQRIDEGQPAGLIDDQMRIAIRTSQFVLADLTNGNRGAYWEAGFAEGLGRPVIYLCAEEKWNDTVNRPHFDTNHLATVIWHEQNLGGLKGARKRLTAMIRNTLPAEAKLDD